MVHQRSEETHNSLVKMISEMNDRQKEHLETTNEIRTALFGPKGQEWMGHIPTTERRLEAVEGGIRKALVGALVACGGFIWQWLSHK